jgi:hypothetical protein
MDASVYEFQPGVILGFHGCDADVGERILSGQSHLKPSEKAYDWLGHGIYFWEGNVSRARAWADERHAAGKIGRAFVLGAIIDLRHCLDLFDRSAMQQVGKAHGRLQEISQHTGTPMPINAGSTPDLAARRLDCAVMNALHGVREDQGLPAYDSIRAPFLEGAPIYEGAGFRSHTHIQICVRDVACIKGYFRPLAIAR